tara:strand:- start:89 stop:814 length:726 start_codon:yes stop_codon:yes gene_type:complete
MNLDFLKEINDINNYETNLFLTVISFFLCLFFALYIRVFFLKYSKTVSSKNQVAQALPVITLITFFIIVTIKSSLALSLGLIGALSIVRFRAPIKEPEELAFIFMSVAVGIGFGSGKIFISTSILAMILIFMHIYYHKKTTDNIDFNLSIEFDKEEILQRFKKFELFLEKVENELKKETLSANFLKMDIAEKANSKDSQLYNKSQIYYRISFASDKNLKNLSTELSNINISFTIFENKNIF